MVTKSGGNKQRVRSIKYQHVGENIRNRRIQLNWTRPELCRQAGQWEQQYVYSVETGARTPSPENLKKFADVLGCTVEDLMQPPKD